MRKIIIAESCFTER